MSKISYSPQLLSISISVVLASTSIAISSDKLNDIAKAKAQEQRKEYFERAMECKESLENMEKAKIRYSKTRKPGYDQGTNSFTFLNRTDFIAARQRNRELYATYWDAFLNGKIIYEDFAEFENNKIVLIGGEKSRFIGEVRDQVVYDSGGLTGTVILDLKTSQNLKRIGTATLALADSKGGEVGGLEGKINIEMNKASQRGRPSDNYLAQLEPMWVLVTSDRKKIAVAGREVNAFEVDANNEVGRLLAQWHAELAKTWRAANP